MSRTAAKTNAARLLERLGIEHELRAYEADPDDLSAENVAAKVGLPPEQVFKTLVARVDAEVVLAVIPGSGELDLKALAAAAGGRRAALAPLREVQPLTGYVRGGVTALACKKDYPVLVDELIEAFDRVAVSAGVRGAQILLAPSGYLRALGDRARLSAIARDKS